MAATGSQKEKRRKKNITKRQPIKNGREVKKGTTHIIVFYTLAYNFGVCLLDESYSTATYDFKYPSKNNNCTA